MFYIQSDKIYFYSIQFRFLVLQHGDHTTHSTTENLIYQITAVALADESSTVPTYKTFVQKTTNDTWLLHDECYTREINPNELQLTKNSVLFYQPVKNPNPPNTGHVLKMPFPAQLADTLKEVTEPYRAWDSRTKLATISEEVGIGTEFKRVKQGLRLKIYDKQLEPGEYLMERGTYSFRHCTSASGFTLNLKSILLLGSAVAESYIEFCLRWRNFPRAAQFFFVCELSGRSNRKRIRKIALRAKNSA